MRVEPSLPAGDPHELGATPGAGGVGFAVWAPEAEAVWLCLFDATGKDERQRWRLAHCSDGVWHGFLAGAEAGLIYGYRVQGRWAPQEGLRFNARHVLLDPYAREIVGQYEGDLSAFVGHDPADPSHPHPLDNCAVALKARVVAREPAPPQVAPAVAPAARVIAEVHVKTATALHPGVPEALRGSYAGLADPAMIAHWRGLGVTTLELLPLQQRADEARLQGLGLPNHWGYSTIGFFTAEPRYWSGRPGTSPASELRDAIAALRHAGFEVVLDMVFNHSAETDELGPTLSFRGLANRHYYRLDPSNPALYANWSGCGNSFNLAQPQVLRFVIEVLRHWVEAYGVDGFRLDLATSLGREGGGEFGAGAAFFGAIQADPLLRRALWIAEPWDLGPSGYQAGAFPAGWLEWNDRSRDALRAYWLQPADGRATRAELARRLAGSSERYGSDPRVPRSPLAGVNFISAHDGFTLADLVSFDARHNQANGENNRDGHHDNLSWNCGVEGPSGDPQVQDTRGRLQRALLATLLLARGTPMLLAGDEIGHSQRGNNNAYCQDNHITWLDWPRADQPLCAFVARLLRLRAGDPALHAGRWLNGQTAPDGLADVSWGGPDGGALDGSAWNDARHRALRVHLAPPEAASETVLMFNPNPDPCRFQLPPPKRGPAWACVLDSHTPQGEAGTAPVGGRVTVPARCVQVWRAMPGG
ncbi:MAG TPA: glycogen debranching protein GlgX [Ideonella sp.]|nr:glycogen debranching protein GlgX [Ideonella sp.]